MGRPRCSIVGSPATPVTPVQPPASLCRKCASLLTITPGTNVHWNRPNYLQTSSNPACRCFDRYSTTCQRAHLSAFVQSGSPGSDQDRPGFQTRRTPTLGDWKNSAPPEPPAQTDAPRGPLDLHRRSD